MKRHGFPLTVALAAVACGLAWTVSQGFGHGARTATTRPADGPVYAFVWRPPSRGPDWSILDRNRMSTAILRPASDGSNPLQQGNAYVIAPLFSKVNENVTQPSSPIGITFITGQSDNDNEADAEILISSGDVPSDVGTVTAVTLWAYAGSTANSGLSLGYSIGGVFVADTATALNGLTAPAWFSSTFTGLSLTKSQIQTLGLVPHTAQSAAGTGTVTVHTLYAVITYTPAGGSPTNAAKAAGFFGSIP